MTTRAMGGIVAAVVGNQSETRKFCAKASFGCVLAGVAAVLWGGLLAGCGSKGRQGEAAAEGVAAGSAVARAQDSTENTAVKKKQGHPENGPFAVRFQAASLLNGGYRAPVEGGGYADLTWIPELQDEAQRILRKYEVPFGALVAVDPTDGRVLAHASHSALNPNAPDLALDATPPAASVFKIVTAAALLEAGMDPEGPVCYHGGRRRLTASLLRDSEADRDCATLAEAMAGSLNVVFAKSAMGHLDSNGLQDMARRFGFGAPVPADILAMAGPANIPHKSEGEGLGFARVAAGFWNTHLSPFHGAWIASVLARGGRPLALQEIARYTDASGNSRNLPSLEAELSDEQGRMGRVASPSVIQGVVSTMERTVTHGTAKKDFHDRKGRPYLPGVRIAGKTGTLASQNPYRSYTWWVGFAPMEDPKIAVAALVVNPTEWRIKASYLARVILRRYLREFAGREPAGRESVGREPAGGVPPERSPSGRPPVENPVPP